MRSITALDEKIYSCTKELNEKIDGSNGKRAILLCGGTGCLSSHSMEIKERFEQLIAQYHLEEKVTVNTVGCFGFCSQGPFVKIYPEDTLYRLVGVTDVDEIFISDEIKPFCYEGLYNLIKGRKTEPKEGSYTTYLFDKGLDKILKKVGEECTEVIIAGSKKDKEETVYELADLLYHCMVLMVESDISLKDVTHELSKRHVVDHKVKQERMQ